MPGAIRNRRWQRFESSLDPLQALRTSIVEVRTNPRDPEARRRLRAIAAEQGLWEELALLLADEARAAPRPEVGAAFYEELADVYENLDNLLEAITAMERVIELAPTAPRHQDRIARLYHRAGAGLKAATAFEQVGELYATVARPPTDDPDRAGLRGSHGDRARAALRAAAALYREHHQLERAAIVYRSIANRWPADVTAWAALDTILHELQRWTELAHVRADRVARTEAPLEKATLLRAQARATEQAGDLAAAAALVAQAARYAPENLSGMVDYADVLARSGQGLEAAAILRARLAEAPDRGASADEIAALRLRLAMTLEDACEDRAGSEAMLAELLAASPYYLPAREWVAARAASHPDPRVHGIALLRYAAALPDHERAGIVIEAGRRYVAAHELRTAVRTFEQATELAPDDDDLRVELEETRASLIVELAATERAAGDLATAERRLRAVLASQPQHVEANLALAECLQAAGRLVEAAEQLRATLAEAPEGTAGERLAPLVAKTAQLMAALGESDESHQLLHEAHRLDRHSLPITLALGESCFARKVWRQAAIHLGGLAGHPHAPEHAAAVAVGLVKAAQAEVRALRPGNAGKHYEAAVWLDPACAPAWHALAERAIEQGDLARVAECLEHEAEATQVPADRLRLWDALGDMARDILGDPGRAERCWQQVAAVGSIAVLEKLLGLLRARGATRDRAIACEQLAAIHPQPRTRRGLVVEAAEAYAAAGDRTRALELAEQLMADSPRDPDAVYTATAIAAADPARVADWLRKVLAHWDGSGERAFGDPRRAELWRRLGDAERDLEHERAAIAAYRRAVQTAPDGDAAISARRALVELAATTGGDAKSSLIALVELEQDPFDVLAAARSAARDDHFEAARAGYELARVLAARLTAEDQQWLVAHPPRIMGSDESYAEPLGEPDRRALVVDDGDQVPLAGLLALLAEAAPILAPDAKAALAAAGLADAKRLPASSGAGAVALYPQIAKAFGGPPLLLHASAQPGSPDLTLLPTQPPLLVLGRALSQSRAESRSDLDLETMLTSDALLRFRIGRIAELARPARLLATSVEPLLADLDSLRMMLPIVLRTRFTELLATLARTDFDAAAFRAYRAAAARAADRVGLLACGDIAIAVQAAGGVTAARHLVQLASTQRYIAARTRLRPHSDTARFARR